jgi:adenylate cyclase
LVGAATVLHMSLLALAPINLILLWRGFVAHRNRLGLLVGSAGVLLIFIHMLAHFVSPVMVVALRFQLGLPPGWEGIVIRILDFDVSLLLTQVGAALLVAAVLIDWLARRAQPFACAGDVYWRTVLTGENAGLRRGRRLLRLLPKSPRCKLCNAPFAGPGGPLMRLLDKGPAGMNPRFCSDCLRKIPLGGAEIELSLLFADVRGSTGLAERVSLREFAQLMNRFYAVGTEVLIGTDALVDRFLGDQVVGLYVPGFAGQDHARRAVDAAQALLCATGHDDPKGPWLPVGIGVHTGLAYVGTVGSADAVADVTVLGDAANTAARLASAAGPGEILVSDAAAMAANLEAELLEPRRLHLRGRAQPMGVRVMAASSSPAPER